MRKKITLTIVCFVVLLSLLQGCAGLSLRKVPVHFDDPYERLGIVLTEPTEEEANEALQTGRAVYDAMLSRLPREVHP